MKTPILGGSYVARSVNAADNRMINLFAETIVDGGKEAGFLSRCPGLRQMAKVGLGPIRGLWQMNGTMYVVSAQRFYAVNSNWQATLIGYVSGDDPVSFADNGTQIFIACNPQAFIYNQNTNVLQNISDPDFPGAATVGFIDGYFVFNEPNSQRFWVTAIYDGTDIDALDFASAEGSPDGIVSVTVDHREAWMFGTNSVEVWYDSGNTDFPLQRIQGAFMETGCAAPYSVAKLDNSLFWLGSDARGKGIIYRAQGYRGLRVSTHAVEYAIQNYDTISDAIGYSYQMEGHSFYVLTFPTANATWVYDVSTNTWHERASFADGQFYRHRSNCQTVFNGDVIVGDYQNGKLYKFDLDYYKDGDDEQKWLRSWRALPTGQNNLKRTAHHNLQLDAEAGLYFDGGFIDVTNPLETESGVPLLTESGETLVVVTQQQINGDPEVLLRWSDDGGHTWSNYHTKSMGKIGNTGTRIIWRRLGMTEKLRDRVYEVSGTDPVKIAIMGAQLTLSPTNA